MVVFVHVCCAENADSCCLNAVLVLRASELLTINSGRHLKVWDMRSPGKKHSKLMLMYAEIKHPLLLCFVLTAFVSIVCVDYRSDGMCWVLQHG